MLALITGASSGIGRALALRFAAEGWDLVLVSRDARRLEEVAARCRADHGVQARTLAADLSRTDGARAVCDALPAGAAPVDALVNNAGVGLYGPFAKTALAAEAAMVELHVQSVLRLTKHVLPGMLERRRGWVLNVASLYSLGPVPFQSIYAATKALQSSFSASLAEEAAPYGVVVTCLYPGITESEFRARAGAGEKGASMGMSAEAVADAGYRGLMRGRREVIPGARFRLAALALRHLPPAWIAGAMRRVNRWRGVSREE